MYKRTGDAQRAAASDIVSAKKMKPDDKPTEIETHETVGTKTRLETSARMEEKQAFVSRLISTESM